MRLYNVTYDISDKNTVLFPRIPYHIGFDEDKETPRVCLADSIQHCIQAMASSIRNLDDGTHIVIREVDVELNDENLICPDELKYTKKVPDAMENQEYWYLKPIKCNIKEVQIIDARIDFDFAWTCIPVYEVEEIIDRYFSDLDFKKERDYCNANELYTDFWNYANDNKLYNAMDLIDDKIACLPWATITRVTNLVII